VIDAIESALDRLYVGGMPERERSAFYEAGIRQLQGVRLELLELRRLRASALRQDAAPPEEAFRSAPSTAETVRPTESDCHAPGR
jgi:hypothetical protein